MSGKPVTDADGGVFDIPDDPSPADATSGANPPTMSWGDALSLYGKQGLQSAGRGLMMNPLTAPTALLGAAGYSALQSAAPSLMGDAPALAAHANTRPDGDPAPLVPTINQPGGGVGGANKPPGMPTVPNLGIPRLDFRGSQTNIDDATKQEAQGVQDAAKAQAQAEQIRAQTAADVAQKQLDYAQQSQQARDAAFQQVKTQQAAVQKQLDDLNNQKIDPNHFWSTRSGAQQGAAALGLALANFSSAFTHQPPINLINEAIDRDISAQRDNLANKRANVQAKQGLLEQNWRIFGNYQDASDMTKAHMLDGLAKQGEAQAAQAATPEIQAKAMQAVGQLRQQAEQLRQGTWARQADMSYKNNMLALDTYKAKMEQYQLQRMTGANGMALRPEDLKEIKDQEAAVRNLQQGATANAKTLQDIGARDRARHVLSAATGGLVSDSPKYGELNAAQEAMAVNANKAQGLQTAQTEKQYENMREGANTPNSPDKGVTFSKAQVQAAREALANTYAARFGMPIEQAQAMVEQKLGPDPWQPENVKAMIRKKAGQ